MLQSLGSQRVGHNGATELTCTDRSIFIMQAVEISTYVFFPDEKASEKNHTILAIFV